MANALIGSALAEPIKRVDFLEIHSFINWL